jgi:Adenylate and Guanylate cyclase catalytic domain
LPLSSQLTEESTPRPSDSRERHSPTATRQTRFGSRATPITTWPRFSRPRVAAMRPPPPGTRRLTATSAKGSSRSPAACGSGSRICSRHERAPQGGNGAVLRRRRLDRAGESVDPEALQRLLARYFERMKGIIESHGGSVEKFIGDAVMAVFGVPVTHEDDALRACRAALEMREALPSTATEAVFARSERWRRRVRRVRVPPGARETGRSRSPTDPASSSSHSGAFSCGASTGRPVACRRPGVVAGRQHDPLCPPRHRHPRRAPRRYGAARRRETPEELAGALLRVGGAGVVADWAPDRIFPVERLHPLARRQTDPDGEPGRRPTADRGHSGSRRRGGAHLVSRFPVDRVRRLQGPQRGRVRGAERRRQATTPIRRAKQHELVAAELDPVRAIATPPCPGARTRDALGSPRTQTPSRTRTGTRPPLDRSRSRSPTRSIEADGGHHGSPPLPPATTFASRAVPGTG